ncbi:DUF6233 domain-containing protein [Streptomyces mirabilis]|uniref:DUF6233 domain-containing protein n=1 Tax=Streptomyces mirabilis TaxID=68239 RepID=UPI0036DC32E9
MPQRGKRSKGITSDTALRALTESGAPACPHCRSDTALGILEGLLRRPAAAVRSSSPRGLLASSFFAVAFLVAAFFFGFGLEPWARDALAWATDSFSAAIRSRTLPGRSGSGVSGSSRPSRRWSRPRYGNSGGPSPGTKPTPTAAAEPPVGRRKSACFQMKDRSAVSSPNCRRRCPRLRGAPSHRYPGAARPGRRCGGRADAPPGRPAVPGQPGDDDPDRAGPGRASLGLGGCRGGA